MTVQKAWTRCAACLVAVSLVAPLAAATAKEYYYRPDWDGGSGSFADGTRYYGGVVPAKSDADDVLLFFDPTKATSAAQAMDVTFSAADLQTLEGLVTRLQPRNGTVTLTFDTGATDVTWSGQIYGGGNDVRIVKTGTGAFRMTKATNAGLSYSGRLVVSNGLFAISSPNNNPASKAWPVLEVWGDGVLQLASQNHMYAKGLCGDGTVRGVDASKQLCLLGGTDEVFTFSGTFETALPVSVGQSFIDWKTVTPVRPNVRQHFTGRISTLSMESRFYSGTLGLEIFDGTDSGSSLGKVENINLFGADFTNASVCIRNLGTADQTTERQIIFFNDATVLDGFNFHLDGGAYGGLTLTGKVSDKDSNKLAANGWENRVVPFYLEGSNTQACVMNCRVDEECATNHLWFVKRGSGTWRFADGLLRGFRTPVSVERGTLEYESIAEKGVNCSLGLATCLSTNWTRTATALIPYAVLLGDGSPQTAADLATFTYAGSGTATCATRPIGVVGAGRLSAVSGSSVYWTGLSAASPAATVVLDGASAGNVLYGVSDGEGVLSFEKRGTGTWTLDGDLSFTGGLAVKAGTLKLALDHAFTWYKFTVLENWGDLRSMFTQFGLWDASGNYLNTNLVWNTAANGNVTSLQPGEAAFGKSGITCYESASEYRSLDHLFDLTTDLADIYASPVLSNPSTALDIVMRLPSGKSKASKYDIFAGNGSTVEGQGYARDARSWSVSGSHDGLHWTEISTVISNVPVTKTKSWYSDGTTVKNSASTPKGFALDKTESDLATPASVAFVEVDAGATLETDVAVSTSRLVYDAAKGGGTLNGFSFDETGTLDLVNATTADEQTLPIDLHGAANLDNLRQWTVRINGVARRHTIIPSASGLTILPPGLRIIIR